MNKIIPKEKLLILNLLLLLVVLAPISIAAQSGSEDEYLTKAFALLKTNPPAAPTEAQNKLIIQVKNEIESFASQRKFYKPSDEIVEQIGETGFPVIAELLRSPDSWTRALAARTLFMLDRPRSITFLIGQLFDDGKFDWMNDVADYKVSTQASGLLSQSFQNVAVFTTPVRNAANPSAKIKAVQNYYWFHLPFCKWMNKVCFPETQRMFTELETRRFGKPSNEDGYEGINYVFIGHFSKSDRFRIGTPIYLGLTFVHFGNRIMKIRWDIRDTNIHKFKLIAPSGEELKLKPEGLPVLHKSIPVVQPQWSQSAIGKDFELSAMYEINQIGTYRLYYEYVPPKEREENEQSKPLHLWHWNGKDYVNYYEFIVE